jgi:hypothetical protein
MKKLSTHVAAFSACALMALAGAAGAPKTTVADLVPANTILLVQVDDATASRAAWNASALSKLIEGEQFKALWKAIGDEAAKRGEAEVSSTTKWLEEAGVKIEELPLPTGSAGLAVIPNVDAKTNEITTGFLSVAVYDAESGKKFAEATDKVIENLEKKKVATITDETIAGVAAKKIKLNKPEKPKDAKPNEMDEEGEEPDALPFEEVYFARTGDTFLIGSDVATLERALDNLAGKGKGETLGSSPGYDAAKAVHQPGTIAHLAAFIEPMSKLAKDLTGKLPEPSWEKPEPALQGIVRSLQEENTPVILSGFGVKGTKALVASLSLDNDTSIAQVDFSVLQKDKGGLLSLIEPLKGTAMPAFVGPEVASVGAAQVRFDKILDVARATIKDLPAETRQSAEAGLAQAEGLIAPILSGMGPEVYVITMLEQPYSASSSHIVGAIKMADPTPLVNTLTAFGGQAGAKPRDFEGHQIWELPEGMAATEMGLGIGLGYVFVGSPKDIENALRSGGRADGPRLSNEARFKAAAATLDPAIASLIWADTAQAMKYMYWQFQNPDVLWEQQTKSLRDMGMNPEEFGMKKPEKPSWVSKLPPIDDVLKVIGDNVAEYSWSATGPKLRLRYLRPAK